MKKKLMISSFVSIVFIGSLISCGSTDTTLRNYNEWNGIFVDTLVSGLYWKCGQKEGVTNKGLFGSCPENTSVTFSIGGIVLGESIELQSHIFTPHDLVSGAKRDIEENTLSQNDKIFKIASLLLSLDRDANASNGIEITSKINQELEKKFSLLFSSLDRRHINNISQQDIESIVNTLALTLNKDESISIIYFDENKASTHLLSTIRDIGQHIIIAPSQPDKVGGAEAEQSF